MGSRGSHRKNPRLKDARGAPCVPPVKLPSRRRGSAGLVCRFVSMKTNSRTIAALSEEETMMTTNDVLTTAWLQDEPRVGSVDIDSIGKPMVAGVRLALSLTHAPRTEAPFTRVGNVSSSRSDACRKRYLHDPRPLPDEERRHGMIAPKSFRGEPPCHEWDGYGPRTSFGVPAVTVLLVCVDTHPNLIKDKTKASTLAPRSRRHNDTVTRSRARRTASSISSEEENGSFG